MDINWNLKNKHIHNPHDVWDVLQQIEKDICFLYHQLSLYSHIMGDLNYTGHYNLPYWNFINSKFPINDDELCFIKEGCLIIILSMAWEQIDDAGSYINDKANIIMNNLDVFEPLNEKQSELHDIVILTVNYAMNPKQGLYEDVLKKSKWVHREFVMGYFRKRVNEFELNPYYRN